MIERIVNLQGLKTQFSSVGQPLSIERFVNLQGLKTMYFCILLLPLIERIVNLPTHIGRLTMFSENKDKNKSRKFQSTKANKVIELLKNRN